MAEFNGTTAVISGGGTWTPGAALKDLLIERLEKSAGMNFVLEPR